MDYQESFCPQKRARKPATKRGKKTFAKSFLALFSKSFKKGQENLRARKPLKNPCDEIAPSIPKRTQPNLGLRPSASFCSFFLAKPDSPESPLVERQRHKDMNIAMDDVPMMGFVRRRIAERRTFMSPALYVCQSQSRARICGPTAVVLSNDPWGREH